MQADQPGQSLRSIRGAIQVEHNQRRAILDATRTLLQAILEQNQLSVEHLIAATFSVTADLDQAYPAEAARQMGWNEVGMLCVQEMAVQDSLARCIRVMILCRSSRPQATIAHCYLGGAAVLRPDWRSKIE